MSEQNIKPSQPCGRCHGSGRVGYVMEDGRRGKYRCPDCQGSGLSIKQHVYTCLLCEGRGDMPIGLGSPSREPCRSCQGKGLIYGSLTHHSQLLAQQAIKAASEVPKVTTMRTVDVESLVDEEPWC